MIRLEPQPEPPRFDEEVRSKGIAWLESNPSKRPKPFWSRVLPELRAAFQGRCAYSTVDTFMGVVDHYLSCKHARHLAYEWSNYRYCLQLVNQYKSTHDDRILDPFEVEDDWFELLLPSFQLVLTDRVPPDYLERARFTLRRLRLGEGQDDARLIEHRQSWHRRFENGRASLEDLDELAPLIARAIRKQQAAQAEARPEG